MSKSLNWVFVYFASTVEGFKRDPSFIYRCENIGRQLIAQGHRVDFKHVSQLNTIQPYDRLVLHRPRMSWHLAYLIVRARYYKKQLVADFDDLIFDPSYAKQSPAVINHYQPYRRVYKNFKAYARAMRYIPYLSVSTEPLQLAAKRLYPDKQVSVIPNAVHGSWLAMDTDIMPIKQRLAKPIITYLPGTKSHDRDFATIAPVIARFLRDHPQVSLSITGPLQVNEAFPEGQLIRQDKVAFADYHHTVREGWVNLAPLEQSDFTDCKSAIKVIEAAFWHKPTLCSDMPDNHRFKEAGALIYQSDKQLYDYLEALLDEDYYQQYSESLRERVLQQAHPQDTCRQFLVWLDT